MAKPTPKVRPAAAHAPGVDDELAAEGLSLVPDRDELDAPGAVLAPEVLERSELASYLLPSAFPASRAAIVRLAKRDGAPPELMAHLNQLPPGRYETVGEIWEALGGPVEHRDTGDAVADEPLLETAPDAEVIDLVRNAVTEVVNAEVPEVLDDAATEVAASSLASEPVVTGPLAGEPDARPLTMPPAPWVDAVAEAAGQFTTWWMRLSLGSIDAVARALLRR